MTSKTDDRKTAGPSRLKVGISASLRLDRRTKYIRNSKTISGRLHDEMVMMDLEQGKYFSLNPVATRIWDLLEKPLTIDEMSDLLIDEYEVDLVQCRKEVKEHLAEMVKLGLVLKAE
jgi:hypothetical protein